MGMQNETGNVNNIQVFDNGFGNCPPSCVDVDSRNLGDCPNSPETPVGITNGVVAKIPVVLAQL
ncbi:hypothetical protein KQI42_18240, partial [Tissierella sp. MSJ-40]|nr:hypothetical protein [Tissierella simiarum]